MNNVFPAQRLTLGTAQFGFDYGAFNQQGKLSLKEVDNILDYAKVAGIRLLDTASSYGESEQVLGDYFRRGHDPFQIITKMGKNLPAIEVITNSLEKLGISSLYGFLVHDFGHYKSNPDMFSELLDLKQRGLVQKIGFSLYYPHELEYLVEHNVPLDLIQVQYSIFDQRFASLFPHLHEMGVEIHTRSVFLQGLFFADTSVLTAHFNHVKSNIERIQEISQQAKIPVGAICLNYALANPNIDQVVIGVDNQNNLRDNIEYMKYMNQVTPLLSDLDILHQEDIDILFPHHWK